MAVEHKFKYVFSDPSYVGVYFPWLKDTFSKTVQHIGSLNTGINNPNTTISTGIPVKEIDPDGRLWEVLEKARRVMQTKFSTTDSYRDDQGVAQWRSDSDKIMTLDELKRLIGLLNKYNTLGNQVQNAFGKNMQNFSFYQFLADYVKKHSVGYSANALLTRRELDILTGNPAAIAQLTTKPKMTALKTKIIADTLSKIANDIKGIPGGGSIQGIKDYALVQSLLGSGFNNVNTRIPWAVENVFAEAADIFNTNLAATEQSVLQQLRQNRIHRNSNAVRVVGNQMDIVNSLGTAFVSSPNGNILVQTDINDVSAQKGNAAKSKKLQSILQEKANASNLSKSVQRVMQKNPTSTILKTAIDRSKAYEVQQKTDVIFTENDVQFGISIKSQDFPSDEHPTSKIKFHSGTLSSILQNSSINSSIWKALYIILGSYYHDDMKSSMTSAIDNANYYFMSVNIDKFVRKVGVASGADIMPVDILVFNDRILTIQQFYHELTANKSKLKMQLVVEGAVHGDIVQWERSRTYPMAQIPEEFGKPALSSNANSIPAAVLRSNFIWEKFLHCTAKILLTR